MVDSGKAQSAPFVTLITDGSFGVTTLRGGWAGRVIFEGKRSTFWGPVASECRGSNCAEIAAIGNTLYYALQGEHIPKGARILVQVDNERTLGLIASMHDYSFKRLSPVEEAVLAKLKEWLKDGTIGALIPQHIKAHLTHSERMARHHVHKALDKFAKKGRRLAEEGKSR